MGIQVNHVEQADDMWLCDLSVRFGVYAREHYPVRLVEVPTPPPGMDLDAQKQRIADFVVQEVLRHMRRGSLPPKGVQIRAERVWETKPETASV
jgi:hypothetical protein